MVLQVCSCAGLVSRSQAALYCFSAVRHRTSRVCTPSPQEREHYTEREGNLIIAEEGKILKDTLMDRWFHPHRAPFGGEPLWFARLQFTRLHWGRLLQVGALTGAAHCEVTSCLLHADDVPALGAVTTRYITLLTESEHRVTTANTHSWPLKDSSLFYSSLFYAALFCSIQCYSILYRSILFSECSNLIILTLF